MSSSFEKLRGDSERFIKLRESDSENSLSFDELQVLKYSPDQLSHRSGLHLLLTTITSVWCGILFGYNTGVISAALLKIQDEIAMNSVEKSALVSIVLAGAVIGCCLAASVMGMFNIFVVASNGFNCRQIWKAQDYIMQ